MGSGAGHSAPQREWATGRACARAQSAWTTEGHRRRARMGARSFSGVARRFRASARCRQVEEAEPLVMPRHTAMSCPDPCGQPTCHHQPAPSHRGRRRLSVGEDVLCAHGGTSRQVTGEIAPARRVRSTRDGWPDSTGANPPAAGRRARTAEGRTARSGCAETTREATSVLRVSRGRRRCTRAATRTATTALHGTTPLKKEPRACSLHRTGMMRAGMRSDACDARERARPRSKPTATRWGRSTYELPSRWRRSSASMNASRSPSSTASTLPVS